MRPVEVWHENRWVPATVLDTRHRAKGWYGLVAWTDERSREGFYRWIPERHLRAPLDAEPEPEVVDD